MEVRNPSVERSFQPLSGAVILVLHHDGEGAQGVILNRPLDADVDAVLPGWGSVVTSPQTLFQGGPVGLDSAVEIGRAHV